MARGSLTRCDIAWMRAQPDVVAVLTALDVPGRNDCGAILQDEPILASLERVANDTDNHRMQGELRYLGQPVCAVIARTREADRPAAAQVAQPLTNEPLPAMLHHLGAAQCVAKGGPGVGQQRAACHWSPGQVS